MVPPSTPPRLPSLRLVVFACTLLAASACLAAEGASALVARPLAARPPRVSPTLFTELPPEQTGVKTDNRYNDPRMWGALYQEFEGGSIGTGIAIGDYDGDGRPDLFVVNKTGSCRLFRNLGQYQFEDVTVRAGVAETGPAASIWKNGVTFVDVNNDGRLDLYVCRFDAPNLLYLNQGDGTFKEAAHEFGLDIKDACVMAGFCDYDRDGWLDVYIATNALNSAEHPKGQRGYLLHNNGNGTFTNVTEAGGITDETQSHSATWWDYDNDGWPDLYVANDYGVPDKLYHNNRNGTFTDVIDQVIPHTAHYSMGSDLADVNNDGRIDLLVADMAATTHQKDQHSIAESRNKLEESPNPLTTAKYMRSALLLNTGTNRCLEASYLAGIAASDWTWSPRLEDFDNDGFVDLFVTNGFNRDPNPDVHERSMRAETTAQRIKVLRDSAVLNERHLAFRNLGDLEFRDVSAEWGVDARGVSFGSAMGDLSGDGNLDIVYTNYDRGITLLRNNGDTGHRLVIELRGTRSNRFGVGATVTLETSAGKQVRQLVLARGYMSSSEPILHFGLGAADQVNRLTVEWPSGIVQAFEKVAPDQRLTISETGTPATFSTRTAAPRSGQFTEVSTSLGLAFGAREEVIDETAAQKLLPVRLNRRGPAVAVGDPSGSLLVVGGTTVDPLRVLVRRGDAYVATGAKLSTGTEVDDGPVLLVDVDGDGKQDLLVTKGGNSLPAGATEYQPKLFLGDGQGGFRPAPDDALPPLAVSAGAAVAADFDRDGRLDVFIGGRVLTGQYPQAPQSALLVNRGGKFEDVTDRVAPGLKFVGMVTSALWSDVDGDGWMDLLVTLDWGQVKYFHNAGGKQLEDWTEKAGFASAGTGWWTSIAAADFNGDGRMDYVVGNVGLNTQYHADPQHPALLYSGDFKGDGSSQLIEAYYEGGKLYPWRSRRGLAAVIPSLLKRFPLNESYANATLQGVFGEEKLKAAESYAATELRSGVLLSQPDGTYRFYPLPRLAQISPLQGIVAGDFDGDGNTDLYAVQNSFAPIPVVGRYDGGLSQLLRGDGHGHFTAVPVADSGLIVSGDAKGLVALDLNGDGWADFVVTRNNAPTLCFHNTGVAGHQPLCVVLRGAAGNPFGIGARLTVEYADGATRIAEVSAGSGYYSQSAPTAFFGYRDVNPVRRVTVRWPDGPTTAREVPPKTTRLEVIR
jgi:hypothetical protein